MPILPKKSSAPPSLLWSKMRFTLRNENPGHPDRSTRQAQLGLFPLETSDRFKRPRAPSSIFTLLHPCPAPERRNGRRREIGEGKGQLHRMMIALPHLFDAESIGPEKGRRVICVTDLVEISRTPHELSPPRSLSPRRAQLGLFPLKARNRFKRPRARHPSPISTLLRPASVHVLANSERRRKLGEG